MSDMMTVKLSAAEVANFDPEPVVRHWLSSKQRRTRTSTRRDENTSPASVVPVSESDHEQSDSFDDDEPVIVLDHDACVDVYKDQ